MVHRSACISTARQVGKSSCLKVLASWWATVMAGIRGEPQTVMIVANEYERASILFREMEPILAEKFGAKSYKSFGRESLTFPDGSTIRLAAATAGKHGYSVDLLLVDEIWDIKPQVIYGALKPSQIARRSPLMSCWSTAGDASSRSDVMMPCSSLSSIVSADAMSVLISRSLIILGLSSKPHTLTQLPVACAAIVLVAIGQ